MSATSSDETATNGAPASGSSRGGGGRTAARRSSGGSRSSGSGRSSASSRASGGGSSGSGRGRSASARSAASRSSGGSDGSRGSSGADSGSSGKSAQGGSAAQSSGVGSALKKLGLPQDKLSLPEGIGGKVVSVAVPLTTAAAGVAGGIVLARTVLRRQKKLLGVPLPGRASMDFSDLTSQVSEAGHAFSKLAGEVRAAREKAEKMSQAIS